MGVGVAVGVDEVEAEGAGVVFGSEPDVLGAVVVHQAIVVDDGCEHSGCQGSKATAAAATVRA